MGEIKAPIKIDVCMGSSCYTRGNRDNVEIIQAYLKEKCCEAQVELKGELCQRNCQEGPIISINGKVFRGVQPVAIRDILEQNLR